MFHVKPYEASEAETRQAEDAAKKIPIQSFSQYNTHRLFYLLYYNT